MTKEVNCPYCLQSVADGAQVCRFCTRDVARLVEAETRVQELEARIRELDDNESPDEPNPLRFRMPLWAFYIASTVCVLTLSSDVLFFLTAILAAVTGAVVTVLHRTANIVTLFLAGFVQPTIGTMALLVSNQADVESLQRLLVEFFQVSVQMGAATAGGSLVVFILWKRCWRPEYFSVGESLDWMSSTESRMDRLQSFLVKTAALVSALTVLASNVLKFF